MQQSNANNANAASNQATTVPTTFSTQGSQHMTHQTNPLNPSDPYEKCTIQFQLPNAIIWQIKFILSNVSSKKSLTTASSEFSQLAEGYGKDFDKYLLKLLIEQIEIKDAVKASKDKTESVKITLLNQELTRASLKPEFLSYFSEIMQSTFGQESTKIKPVEFLQEITKRLKLNAQTQILVTLSMLESTEDEQVFEEILKMFRQKLIEFHINGKPEQLPEYAVHRILHLFDTLPELSSDPQLREPKQFIIETNANRYAQFTPLRSSLHQDISQLNCHAELPSYNILKDGCGLEHLEFVHRVLQPWEVLIDIGHNSSYMYDFLLKTLSEFKAIDEKVMAQTILQLAIHHQGKDDHISKIVYNTFESNKDGNPASIKKEPEDKKTQMSWSVDNLARAFRELYSTLNWNKVFDSFGEIEPHEVSENILEQGLDPKQFQTLMQLFNKSKPQNFPFPLQNVLSQDWKCPQLQLTFVKNCILQYVSKKDKSIQFNKLKVKTQTIPELMEMKERGESTETIEVWQSVDLVERLIILSESRGLFVKVRKVFEHPIKQLPEYLLLSLSMAKPSDGNIMIDELLSILLPLFLGNHANSSIVLQHLFEANKSLFIRGICELCKHDQRLMNLSRVLDITQEVKDSLIPIVYCEDYNFAVNLGILAGKRDFLHYDVWIKSRIKDVGTPFILALIKYIQEHIINPVSDFVRRNQSMAETNPENFEAQKNAILERSHLSKDKLILTIEHLQNPALRSNDKIHRDTLACITDLVTKNQELFPQHYEPGQNSEEIDAAANEHFQRVFSAEKHEVDARIEELIQTMQNFKESQVVKEQEIYACMLHGLFDEYRFLHRYPQQYLTKIAKLFGAIIKNNLLDRVLQDIALKFVIEAFRRDGRRQKFGIIVIKSFFDMLPQFPRFLEDIYQIRQSIQSSEPQMMADIERLYQEMVQSGFAPAGAGRSEAETDAATNESCEEHQNYAAQLADQISAEENKHSEGSMTGNLSTLSINSARMGQPLDPMPLKSDRSSATNQSDQKQQVIGQTSKDGNKKNAQGVRGNQQLGPTQGGSNSKQNAKSQRGNNQQHQNVPQNQNTVQVPGQTQSQQQQVLKSMTPPMVNQTKEFIPTNRGGPGVVQSQAQQQLQPGQLGQVTGQAQQIAQAKVFIPTAQKQGQPSGITNPPQPSQLVDHVNMSAHQQQQFKLAQQKTTQQLGQQQQPGTLLTAGGGSSLNISSAAFQRPMSTSNSGQGSGMPYDMHKLPDKQININSKEFMPSRSTQEAMLPSAKNVISQSQIQELLDFQKVIDERIKRAVEQETKVRLDELLDDQTIKVENEYVEDQIRIICNNTGRGNFKQKIEDLKKFVIKKAPKIGEDGKELPDEKSAKADDHLRWFIHYILTKRLGAQSVALQNIYVEMLRELNQAVQQVDKARSVVGLTLSQAALIFKKCMVIDEEEFMKVTNVAQGSAAVIKSYLASLGSFVGTLTLAKNEPIRSVYLDLKQILIEGYQIKNRRLAVTFVCRILKESQHSRVFTPRNPWINTLMAILREIYDFSQLLHNKQNNTDNLMEIDSLFKALNVQNSTEIKPHRILAGLSNPNSYVDQVIRKELDFMYRKVKMILPSQPAPPANASGAEEGKHPQHLHTSLQQLSSQASALASVGVVGGAMQASQSQYSESEMLKQQKSQISQRVSVSGDLMQIFSRFQNFNEQKVRKLVGNAVDHSIVEILPPVVDRSVTIALITTRELVLKDFAYDGDHKRVLKAADLIVQNLAGSLALVTCREPLRMSLTTNLKKIFDQHFKCELGLDILSNSNSGGPPSEQADNAGNQNAGQANAGQSASGAIASSGADSLGNPTDQGTPNASMLDGAGYQTTVSEEQINEIAVLASKENLELGCKLIKKEVIEKALKKVREDLQIIQAVERRKRSEELGIRLFRDESIVAQFQELPPQLQPNQNGLTQAQFQVYEDFSKLGQPMRDLDTSVSSAGPLGAAQPEGAGAPPSSASQQSNLYLQQQQPQNLTSILKLIDQFGLTEVNKGYLLAKIQHMNQSKPTDEEREKLWTYVQRNLETACKNYDSRNPQGVEPIIQVLSLIVTSYEVENFSKKLLTNVFLQLDVRIFNEVELNILLMSKGIISISEWDSQLAIFFKESAAQLPESELQFFANFLETSIVEKKILTKEEVPQLIAVLEKMSHDKKIGKFCQYILETLNFKSPLSPASAGDASHANLREFFIKWVVMSYVDDRENQEKQMNTFFQELRGLGIDTEPKLLFSFCKVMVQTSIEKALVYGDESGEKRPADRLDFRYIDSFVKLIVVLLKMFSFNKHEFMTKVLEFIGEVLDEDHRTKKAEFNQRPYYRMLMNILTAVNHSDCFNQKTQLLTLFSMADLFKNLSPTYYPAFCFSWLELISHKQFLPHFLRAPAAGQGPQNLGVGGPLGQQQFLNMPPLQGASGLGPMGVDNTFYQKRFKIKELVVNVFSFLKNNMIPGQSVPPAIQAFYHATLRVISVIKHDFPDFLSDFHFNLVNSLPDHCIQLRNLILSAYPANIQQPDPFRKDLKIDLLSEIKQNPRILSNYDNFLSLMNLREDLENYTRTRNQQLITEICHKMEQSGEDVNGRRRINSNVISAVVLFIAAQALQQKPGIEKHRESMDTFKQIVQRLNDETRLCFLNAIINELRFPNNHTFYFSCIILFIFAEAGREIVYEQISSVFLERLQTCGPHPWGLMISFRELIQNPKFAFMRKQYIREHPQSVALLFQGSPPLPAGDGNASSGAGSSAATRC